MNPAEMPQCNGCRDGILVVLSYIRMKRFLSPFATLIIFNPTYADSSHSSYTVDLHMIHRKESKTSKCTVCKREGGNFQYLRIIEQRRGKGRGSSLLKAQQTSQHNSIQPQPTIKHKERNNNVVSDRLSPLLEANDRARGACSKEEKRRSCARFLPFARDNAGESTIVCQSAPRSAASVVTRCANKQRR